MLNSACHFGHCVTAAHPADHKQVQWLTAFPKDCLGNSYNWSTGNNTLCYPPKPQQKETMKNVNHWGFIVPYKKALYSVCGTTVSLTPDKPVRFFPLLQRVNKTYSGLFQSCLFKRVISPSLIQIQIWILPIRSLQRSSPVSYLSWVYLASVFSWLPAFLQDFWFGSCKISLRDPSLKRCSQLSK